jgi:hypothetical protein
VQQIRSEHDERFFGPFSTLHDSAGAVWLVEYLAELDRDIKYHKKNPEPAAKDILSNIGLWSRGIDSTSLIYQFFNGQIRVKDNHDFSS